MRVRVQLPVPEQLPEQVPMPARAQVPVQCFRFQPQ
jgi:hypothetical protein